jgi:AcrR family transcriptional regulator
MATRTEHRRQTLRRLSDAAVDLFEAQGPRVTIESIAERAGVARRTVFRYVDAKEELAFIHPVLWFDVFEAGLNAAPDADLASRLRRASRGIALHIDADPLPPRRAFLVVAANPELAQGYTAVFQRWVDRVADEVLSSHEGDINAHARFRARIIGAAVMGMVDAVVREWVSSPAGVTFTELYDEGFDLLAPLVESPE